MLMRLAALAYVLSFFASIPLGICHLAGPCPAVQGWLSLAMIAYVMSPFLASLVEWLITGSVDRTTRFIRSFKSERTRHGDDRGR